MRLIDEQFLKTPFYGSRQMARFLKREGYCVSRNRVRRLMKKMGITAVYQAPRTSIANKTHRIYPYLLRGVDINHSNQVWCTDITYLPTKSGFMYLIAVMDWYSRKVLSWRISNTMDINFCIEALEQAIDNYGVPIIFNTDQGSQFTSFEFTNILHKNKIKISMDGNGRWMDNVFIERLWRSLKYEALYLHNPETGSEVKSVVKQWIEFYNSERPHSTFDGSTPNEVYFKKLPLKGNTIAA
jgi:putative transposase